MCFVSSQCTAYNLFVYMYLVVSFNQNAQAGFQVCIHVARQTIDIECQMITHFSRGRHVHSGCDSSRDNRRPDALDQLEGVLAPRLVCEAHIPRIGSANVLGRLVGNDWFLWCVLCVCACVLCVCVCVCVCVRMNMVA